MTPDDRFHFEVYLDDGNMTLIGTADVEPSHHQGTTLLDVGEIELEPESAALLARIVANEQVFDLVALPRHLADGIREQWRGAHQ